MQIVTLIQLYEVSCMERIIPLKESLTVEFKSDLKKYDDSRIFEDVIAFANTEGGDLYLGVEDSGEITGVHKDHQNTVGLSAYIANNTIPPVLVRTEMIMAEKPVIRISVPKSYGGIRATVSGKIMRRRLKSDGSPENIPMYPTEIATRLSDIRLLDMSAMMVMEASEDDLDPLEIERLRKIVALYDGESSLLKLSNEELMLALGFIRNQNGIRYPTVTGLLIAGKIEGIQKYVPTHKIAFQVLDGTSVRVNDEFCLPILAAIEKILDYTDAQNSEQEIEIGMFRMPAPVFSKRALREAIVNAFSHRDYSKMGRIRIAVDDEGITIASPGGFIDGVTVETLLTAEPCGRNMLLADALKRIGLAEKTGRGIDRIFEGSLIYGKALPDYSGSNEQLVSLFIPRCSPDVPFAKIIANEQKRLGRPLGIRSLMVLNMLKNKPDCNIQQMSQELHLTEAVVRTIIDNAVSAGIAEPYRTGKYNRYHLSPELYQKTPAEVVSQKANTAEMSDLVISFAKSHGQVTRADTVKLLGVAEAEAYTLLRKLVASGDLILVNKGRYAKYLPQL